MSTKALFTIRSRVLLTALGTMGWWVLVLGWMVFTWSRHSFFQDLVILGIAALLYAAIMGAVWVVDLGFTPTATVLVTFGSLSFVLYWIGFAWSRHTLLQNSAILMLSLLAWGGAVAVLWLARPADRWCR